MKCRFRLQAILIACGMVWSAQVGAQPVDLSWSLGPEGELPQTPLRPLPTESGVTSTQNESCGETPNLQRELPLSDAVVMALCNHPQTRRAWSAAIEQAAGVGNARSAFLPTASASVGKVREELDSQPPVTANTKSVSLNYVLWDFGLRSANLDAAEKSLAAALAAQDSVLQTVFSEATSAYYEAATTQASLEATISAQAAAEESLNAAQARQRQGAGTPTDALQARSAYSKAVLDRVRAEGSALTARGSLAFTMGFPAQTVLTLPANLLTAAGELPGTEFMKQAEELIAEAKVSHPTILAAQAQLEAAQARVKATEAEGLPSISVNGSRYLNGRPGITVTGVSTRETTYGVVMSVPLFEGFGRGAKVNAARAQVESKASDVKAAELQVTLDIWKAYQELRSQTSALQASLDLLESADLAFKAIQARYRVGAAGIVDVLNSQSALANARQQRVLTLGSWRTARLKLLGSIGRLGPWAIGNRPA